MTKAQTLFDKIWARHTILERPDGATLLHVARHLVHDGSRASFGALTMTFSVGRVWAPTPNAEAASHPSARPAKTGAENEKGAGAAISDTLAPLLRISSV